ncbi:MAG: hypothetical protein LBN04_08205 [Oscillospiraceae bacterium]|jgi:hypothetical protein|nr:hypothetical protein [Oscillospiraceae bacterium]
MLDKNPIDPRMAGGHALPRAMPADGYWGWGQWQPDKVYMPPLHHWFLRMLK